jgi:hypothetical protein
MKKIIFIFAFITCYINYNFAQITEKEGDLKKVSGDTTDGWDKGGMVSLTFGQASFTNWSAGGMNSISVNGLSNLFGNYKKGKLTWDNTLDIGYGFQRQGKKENVNLLKTDDKIDFATKLGFKATDKIYYAALVNFKTQFTEGFNYPDPIPISSFLAPGYLLAAIGIDYKPNKYFSAFIAPLTSKSTIVNNDSLSLVGAFGVDPGKSTRIEFGGYIKAAFSKDLTKNINLTTKIDVFSNYLNNPIGQQDVNWELLLSMKINKYMSANISTQVLYDQDVIQKTQVKEILGIGFSYKF